MWTRQPVCCCAGGRNIDHALVGEAVAGLANGLLVEYQEFPERRGRGGGEGAVDPAQDGFGLVVVAVADIRGGSEMPQAAPPCSVRKA